MLGGKAIVDPGADLGAGIGAVVDSRKWLGEYRIRLGYVRLNLVQVLEVEEENQSVLKNRTTDCAAGIPARKERIRSKGLPLKPGIGRHVVIAKVEIGAAMIVVAAGAGHDVDRAT